MPNLSIREQTDLFSWEILRDDSPIISIDKQATGSDDLLEIVARALVKLDSELSVAEQRQLRGGYLQFTTIGRQPQLKHFIRLSRVAVLRPLQLSARDSSDSITVPLEHSYSKLTVVLKLIDDRVKMVDANGQHLDSISIPLGSPRSMGLTGVLKSSDSRRHRIQLDLMADEHSVGQVRVDANLRYRPWQGFEESEQLPDLESIRKPTKGEILATITKCLVADSSRLEVLNQWIQGSSSPTHIRTKSDLGRWANSVNYKKLDQAVKVVRPREGKPVTKLNEQGESVPTREWEDALEAYSIYRDWTATVAKLDELRQSRKSIVEFGTTLVAEFDDAGGNITSQVIAETNP
ncbi:hypothetical protein KOR34_04850 [Posidoniimonas corsicana]|uniref:Uncharacterized protein n=2 Tax=Posidoniimonas corsicana TaxID=1938618 RepID=A0A5C5VD12_9BACT|nr:hypothetical protein KOR34_04850 [Posidoniimonas corsicana]